MSNDTHHHVPQPLGVPLNAHDSQPTWAILDKLFARYGLRLPVSMRDELAIALEWAKYGYENRVKIEELELRLLSAKPLYSRRLLEDRVSSLETALEKIASMDGLTDTIYRNDRELLARIELAVSALGRNKEAP